MNYVNLIGKIVSEPKILELDNGRKTVQFSLSTCETVLTEDGSSRQQIQRHRIIAWGKWVQIMEELGTCDLQLAIEGRLIHRFYQNNGHKKCVSEVEINNLVIL